MKDDTISRKAALSALNGLTEIYLNNLPPTIDRADAVDAIKALPHAIDTNVGGNLIDRQAAIKSIQECADAAHSNYEWDMEEGYLNSIDCIKELPSAQSELEDKIRAIGYTGREGRIYIGGRLFAVRELPQ